MEEDDVERLIELIKNSDILWNVNNPMHKNRLKKAKEWNIISKKCGLPYETVKKKWKGLRDTYSRALNKKNVSGQGTDESDIIWKYSESMEFLKEHLKPRIAMCLTKREKEYEMEEDDVERLIELIKNRDILWNLNHPMYKNRLKKAKEWKIISKKCGLSYETVKRKWKGLRDTYSIVNKKNVCGQGTDDPDLVWKYTECMEFLKEHLKPRNETCMPKSEKEENDTEKLIELIKNRDILWNLNNPMYKNVAKKEKEWKIISEACGLACETVKKKWKALRDKYSRTVNKNSVYGQGTDDDPDSVWKYSKSLEFLKEHLKPRNATWLIKRDNEYEMEEDDVERLIELIKNRDILWNLNHPMYKNLGKKAKVWNIISKKCGLPYETVKRKWKGLRDTYSRIVNKKYVCGQGTDDPDTVWKYSESMEFLKEHLKPRKATWLIKRENEYEMEEDDVEKLIELIKNRDSLWNPNHPMYKHIVEKAKEWKTIAEECGLPYETVKRKWKGLRDTYSRTLNKKNVSGHGTDDPDLVWKYSKSMAFLKEHLKTRTTISNNSISSQEDASLAGASSSLPAFCSVDFKIDPIAETPERCSSSERSDPFRVKRMSEDALCEEFLVRKPKEQKKSSLEETLVYTLETVQEYLNKPREAASASSARASSSDTTCGEDELYFRSMLAKLSTFPIELRNEAKIGMMRYLCNLQNEYLKSQ